MRSARSPSRDGRRNDVELWHVRLESLHVVVVHHPLSSFAESVVGYGCLLRPYDGRVCGESVEVLVDKLLESVAAADESDEHEHAPKHAESGEEGARFVAG